jgi:hypothetical protein
MSVANKANERRSNMTLLLKIWLAAVFATMALYYGAHSVEFIKEAVSANRQDGSGDRT